MIKLLHTSDWHLGQTLHTYDRVDEGRQFLRDLAEVVGREQPDVMVVSGDVFNVGNPSAQALRAYTEGMVEVCGAARGMEVFVTGGNHDSGARLEVDGLLWERMGVHVVGGLRGAGDMVWRVAGKCVVAAVPYFSGRVRDYGEVYGEVDEEVRRVREGDEVVVYMGHAAVLGAEYRGQEDSIGNLDWVDLGKMGGEYDYLALGHIHRRQTIEGSGGRARYCGTPLMVSFDERGEHGVDIVELERGREPVVRHERIVAQRELLTIPEEPMEFEDALRELGGLEDGRECYVRLNVKVSGGLRSDALVRAGEVMEGKRGRFCGIKSNWEGVESGGEERHLQMTELKEMDPVEVARMTWKEQRGEEMGEELVGMLRDLVEEEKKK